MKIAGNRFLGFCWIIYIIIFTKNGITNKTLSLMRQSERSSSKGWALEQIGLTDYFAYILQTCADRGLLSDWDAPGCGISAFSSFPESITMSLWCSFCTIRIYKVVIFSVHNCYLKHEGKHFSPFNMIVIKVLLREEDLKFETGHVRQL